MGAVKEASAKAGGLEGDLLVDGAGDGQCVNVVFGRVALEDGSALEWLIVAADLEPSVGPALGNEVKSGLLEEEAMSVMEGVSDLEGEDGDRKSVV